MAMQVLEPKQRVLFLDTSALPDAAECQAGDQLSNPAEADMIMRIVENFHQLGVQSSSIGIVSPYRSQVIAIDVGHPLVASAGLHSAKAAPLQVLGSCSSVLLTASHSLCRDSRQGVI